MRSATVLICAIPLIIHVGCSGADGDNDNTAPDAHVPPVGVCASGISPGPAPIRRLTREEYNNTVYQLLGDTTFPANKFSPDEEVNGFTNQAAALVVSPLLAEQYLGAAEDLAERHAPQLLEQVSGCAGANPAADACNSGIETFINDFGKRTFRRPLSGEEITVHQQIFTAGTTLEGAGYNPLQGMELLLQAMLQSPHFLYRVEIGHPDPIDSQSGMSDESGDLIELTSYEVASRLSYLLWGTMPDIALFEAADRDELRTPSEIAEQARRMLAAPRARDAVRNFHRQWLGLNHVSDIAAIGKDRTIYPDYDPTLLPLMQRETEEFLEYVVFDGPGDADTIFTASFSFLNDRMAAFYGSGATENPEGAEFEKVELDPNRYAGILTHPGLLAAHSKTDSSSPVHRGKFIRERILCQSAPPPPDVVPPAPEVDPTLTTREQYLMHEAAQECRGCHQQMDAIGFGLEHFDALGRYRETQNGKSIDASGEIIGTLDADGVFDGALELANRLGSSEQVRECVTIQWFRYGYGRNETLEDSCTLDFLRQSFADSNYNIKEFLVALTQTDAFRYRKRVELAE